MKCKREWCGFDGHPALDDYCSVNCADISELEQENYRLIYKLEQLQYQYESLLDRYNTLIYNYELEEDESVKLSPELQSMVDELAQRTQEEKLQVLKRMGLY